MFVLQHVVNFRDTSAYVDAVWYPQELIQFLVSTHWKNSHVVGPNCIINDIFTLLFFFFLNFVINFCKQDAVLIDYFLKLPFPNIVNLRKT